MKGHGGKLPTTTDYGTGPGKVGVARDQMFGLTGYRTGATHENSRIFDSPEAVYTALAQEAKIQGIPFRFIDVTWKTGIPEKLRPLIQSESIAMILNWMKAHDGKVPAQKDYGVGPDKVGMNHSRLFGTGSYRTGGERETSRIFDSREAAMAALKDALEAEGMPWPE